MNYTYTYSNQEELPYVPYIYKITISKGDETKYYIGSKSHQTKMKYGDKLSHANPQLFLEGLYNGKGKINDCLKQGWSISGREVIKTFSGDDAGQKACGKHEGELLREVNACSSELYLNDSNSGAHFIKHTEETKRQISNTRNGFKHSEETKKKMSATHKGKQLSEADEEALINSILLNSKRAAKKSKVFFIRST